MLFRWARRPAASTTSLLPGGLVRNLVLQDDSIELLAYAQEKNVRIILWV